MLSSLLLFCLSDLCGLALYARLRADCASGDAAARLAEHLLVHHLYLEIPDAAPSKSTPPLGGANAAASAHIVGIWAILPNADRRLQPRDGHEGFSDGF